MENKTRFSFWIKKEDLKKIKKKAEIEDRSVGYIINTSLKSDRGIFFE